MIANYRRYEMKTIKLHIALVICCVFSLSCDGSFFMSSLFGGLDPYKEPSSGELGNGSSILDLAEDDQFYDYLKDNPEEAEKAIQTLEKEAAKVKAKQDKQNAGTATEEDAITPDDASSLLTLANVEYTTSGADEILENVNDVASDFVSSDPPKFETMDDVIDTWLPVDKTKSKEQQNADLIKKIDGLLAAADDYALYEDILTDENGDFTPVDDDANSKEDVATKALYAGLVSYVVDNLNTVPQEIKDANPELDENDEDDLKELKKLTAVDAIVNEKGFPDYTLPDVGDSSSDEEEIQAMLEEAGLSEVVNSGLDLDAFLSQVSGG